MSTTPGSEHPSLSLPVSDEQRRRAESSLMDAYADGRLSEEDFERRIGLAIGAGNRRELNEAFLGLVDVSPAPQTSSPYGTSPYGDDPYASGPYGSGYSGSVVPARRDSGPGAEVDGPARATAAVAHFLPLVSWLFGPGLIFLISQPGSFARREAAKAFNFQVVATTGLLIAGMSSWILPDTLVGLLFSVVFVGWLIGTITGGAKAASGEDWKNPVKKVVPWQILPEGQPAPKRLDR